MDIILSVIILIGSFVIAGKARRRVPNLGFGKTALIWFLGLSIPLLLRGLLTPGLLMSYDPVNTFTWYLVDNFRVTLQGAFYFETICLRTLGTAAGIAIAWVMSIMFAPGKVAGASVKLWGGIDPRTFAAIRAALDESHIAHNDMARESPLSSSNSSEPMQIWIGKVDGLAAQKILEGIVGHDEAAGLTPDAELARDSAEHNPFGLGRTMFSRVPGEEDAISEEEELAEPEPAGGPVPDDLVENFDPGEATCEVWAGDDGHMAQIFKECLQNVGIGSVVNEDGGKTRLLVLPSAEKRAREVIREIVDQAPPE